MTFREVAFASDEYHRTVELREAVLRKPLGLTLATEDLNAEREHLHFALLGEDGALIGSVIAVPVDAKTARLRQMAVAPEYAGQGHGAKILREVESALRQRGYQRLTLHARAAVSGFYEKSGYKATGPGFEEVGIPHLPMAKSV